MYYLKWFLIKTCGEKKYIEEAIFNTGSEGSEELQYSAVHDGDLRKSHPEVEGNNASVCRIWIQAV